MIVTILCNSLLASGAARGGYSMTGAARTLAWCGRMKTAADPSDKIPAARFVSVDLNAVAEITASEEINFEDHRKAFRQKTTWEVARSLCVLRMSGINTFAENGLTIMNWTRRTLGGKGLRAVFKPILFKQFVGGENPKEIQECLRRLRESGVRPMLAAAMEEDISEGGEINEKIYEANCAKIMECLEIATAEDASPMMQLKMTALVPPDLLVTLGEEYATSNQKLQLIRTFTEGLNRDEGFSDNPLPERLDESKLAVLNRSFYRLKKIGEDARCRRVKVLVDAEYTYVNPGISLLTLAMVSVYNKGSPLIWNTYQCYLKGAKSTLSEEMELVHQLDAYFGAKLVRGAYMDQERARAQATQKPDPICADYSATNANYDTILEYVLEETIKKWHNKCTFIAATHNEKSIKLAIEKMKELDVDKQNGCVCFGQLYGMCDQVTHALAASGYVVYKSIPYGTVEETLPYLARRAAENKTVLTGTRKEQSLLWKEMKYRLRPKWRRHAISRT